MKKAFDQTVRDLKREVNKKVLKVPSIEQKVLDSTSNEPWGPHGTLLADIAQATRNYHEYQMIMSVIWKRINDTGKNWRHVYKALIVLEYLVAHGSERVIDEIREHAYQISTLSDFQYIDSSGRDQGNNVRRKSQSLVVLVNDKERILEVRQKAVANRDKFRGGSSTGGMYKPGSYSSTGYGDRYDDDRYEGRYRDEDRNGYGREREWGYRDDDRYGRNGDSYGRDVDRHSRDSDERYGRDNYGEDDFRGRTRSMDEQQYGSRSRSADRDHAYDDNGQYSSRESAKGDDHSQDGRRLDRKYSEQNLGAPPSYEEAVGDARSPTNPVHDVRDGETSVAPAPIAASPPAPVAASPPASSDPSQLAVSSGTSASPVVQQVDSFDEFDPRSSVAAAAPVASSSAEMDLLGSLSDSFSSNVLAIMPVTSATTTFEADASTNSASGSAFAAAPSASTVMYQTFEDPFGDSPFKAQPSTDNAPAQPQNFASTAPFQSTMNQSSESLQPVAPNVDAVTNLGFGETFHGINYTASSPGAQFPSTDLQFMSQELSAPQQETDILADILPPSGPSSTVAPQTAFPVPTGQQPMDPGTNVLGGFLPQPGSTPPVASHMGPQTPSGPAARDGGNLLLLSGSAQAGYVSPLASHMGPQTQAGPARAVQYGGGSFFPQSGLPLPPQQNSNAMGGGSPQAGPTSHMASQPSHPSSSGLLAIVPQPSKDKFEPKSAVWADTLSRGLVNLNISGPKINPLADIGIDFDAINRKEKRMEKPAAAPVTSTVNMGKAMGSGSGIGRAGASALRAPPNPMMGSGMGMGMGMGMGGAPGVGMGMGMGGAPGVGMGMGGYGGMNQQPMGVGMGMNMGMNLGMGQGVQMQPPAGLPPGSTMPGSYNPMVGGGYVPQQPYSGGYR